MEQVLIDIDDLAIWIGKYIPPSRHRSIALTELENVRYRINSAIEETYNAD